MLFEFKNPINYYFQDSCKKFADTGIEVTQSQNIRTDAHRFFGPPYTKNPGNNVKPGSVSSSRFDFRGIDPRIRAMGEREDL